MNVSFAPALTLLSLVCGVAFGQTTTTVVDVPTRNVTQRFLYVRPAAPIANIIYLPGGTGHFDFQNDGTINGDVGCSPVYRVRQAVSDRGFAIGFVDAASDGLVHNEHDAAEVQHYMQQRDNVPTWIIGGSSSTRFAAVLANFLPASSPVGVIFFSPPPNLPASLLAAVRRDALVVYHGQDSTARPIDLYNGLTSAPVKELAALDGGMNTGCGYHLFQGIDDLFTTTITGFMERNNNSLSSGVAVVAVVEYHHAIFDHYFITPVPAEIALLDAHAPPFQDWSRTGFTFNAYVNAGAPAASVAICRFFNTSFAPKSSHFYAARGFGCEDTIRLFPDWGIEDDKLFNEMLPAMDGACPAGTIPVYRLYNQGMGGAPNHRFVTSLVERQNMVNQGWVAEGSGIGVGMCAPG